MKLSLINITSTVASTLSPYVKHETLYKTIGAIAYAEGKIEARIESLLNK